MKNIIVLHLHNLSAAFLAEQQIKKSIATNFDSCHVLNKTEGSEYQAGLQSQDGAIQFWHFKHKTPQDGALKNSEMDIRPVIAQLKASLPAGETINAIAIPTASGLETQALKRWLVEMKQEYPSLKVLASNPNLSFEDDPRHYDSRLAIPLSKKAEINTKIKKIVICHDNPTADYNLAEGVDVATKNQPALTEANLLRQLVGVPPLAQKSLGL